MIIMKKLTSLLIGCSLALAGAALAQQPVEQQSPPSKGKRAPEKAHATQAQPGANAAKPQEKPAKQTGAMKESAGAATTSATPAAAAAGAAPSVSAAGQQNAQANVGAKAKKPDPQQVQQIKSQHANFKAQPKPQQVPAVTFNQNHRIEGSDRWQGQQYEVFRSYHAERHDEGWYHSHYPRVELIGGGYYYFNNDYWFPAWGY